MKLIISLNDGGLRMKNLKMMLMALLALGLIVGCGKESEENQESKETTPLGVITKIQETLADKHDLSLEDDTLSGYMLIDMKNVDEMMLYEGIFDEADIESGYVLQPMMNVKSELIMVAKAKDGDSAKNIKASYERVLSDQEATWSHYLPDQYEFVKNNEIKIQGNYVLYATSEYVDEVVEIFEGEVK